MSGGVGVPPAAGFTVRVWNADKDGGLSCPATPPALAQTVALPAAGRSAYVRVSPGNWCTAETERRSALTTTYASAGGTTLGEWHVANIPPAPGVRTVTITNSFAAATAPNTTVPTTTVLPTTPPPTSVAAAPIEPTLPSTGSTPKTTAMTTSAALLLALGLVAHRLSRTVANN